MSIAVRDADFGHDRDELIRFCHENLADRPDGRRFDWLYLNNPFGAARALIATDDKTGETVGVSSAFPRYFWVSGKKQRAWVLGDFCISEEFRSLGPAVILQRACMASLPQDDLWYDFPGPSMMAVYRRLGVPLFGKQVRYVKPLKLDPSLGKLQASITTTVSAFGNWNLRRSFRRYKEVECSVHEGLFGEEFTELDSQVVTQYSVQGSRTAEYLNWRYRQNPAAQYLVLTARQDSKLVGYLVVRIEVTEAILTDLIAIDEQNTVSILVAHLVNFLLQTSTRRLNVSLLRESVLTRYFRRAGFIARETVPVVVSARLEMSSSNACRPQNWLLMQGDRES